MEPNESNKTLALLVITSVSKMETIPNRCAAPYGVFYTFRSMAIDPNWFLKVLVYAERVYRRRPVDLVERGNELPVPLGFSSRPIIFPPKMPRTADISIPHQVVRHRGGRGSRAVRRQRAVPGASHDSWPVTIAILETFGPSDTRERGTDSIRQT